MNRPSLVAALLAGAISSAQAATNPATELEAPTVEVVGTTPLPGIGTPIDQVPANVHAITGESIRQQNTIDLSQYLNRNVSSVNITDGQVNPFMPDLNFRGFTGSPLLGVPQGISAFMDGVRINEAFGDTINWDLIPQSAISTVNLIPGSNPVFGLNTLGGALSINTKSGKEYPGGSAWTEWGSWGRNTLGAEFGSKKGPLDFYITGNYLDENGWRDHSSSRLNQWFAKIGYETADFDADLSYSFADNELQGTQASPLSLLDFARQQSYTYPDITNNRLNFVNLRVSKLLTPEQVLAGNIYYRGFKSSNLSSNVNDAFTAFPCPAVSCPATLDQSTTDTDGSGATLQYTLLRALGGHDNKFTVGASLDYGNTLFTQFQQQATFTNDRNTVGAAPFTPETNVQTVNRYSGLYLTDTYSFNAITHLTLSGRYNRAHVNITDRSGTDPSLNGDHTFVRFNPAIGLNYNPKPALNTYASYNEGLRAPTPVELTCADPTAPCKLPNAFLADPPLQPVVSKTWELGTRGMLTANTFYSASIFRTDLHNDIQFVSASASNTAGFFQNIGKTRRQGVELGLQQRIGKLQLKAAYTFLDATYQSAFTVNSPNNTSSNAAGDIQVQPGDRIPGIPRNNFKLRGEYAFTPAVVIGANLIYASNQYARGDENNQDANGPIPPYMVVNLDAHWDITEQLQVFGTITNLFNRKYETFGVLGENFFRGPGFTFDAAAAGPEQFRSPAAPLGIWIGVRYAFGGAKVSGSTPRDKD